MKKKWILIIFVLYFFDSKISAQEEGQKSFFYLNIGTKYTPIEYLGGPSIGLYFQERSDKFSIGLRKDLIMSVGKSDQSNNFYQLTKYYTYNYLDIFYKFKEKMKFGAGFGWIYDGKRENIKLNKVYGYASASIVIQYKIAWLFTEIRGDLPLEKSRPEIDQGHLFPVSIALIYSFIPSEN